MKEIILARTKTTKNYYVFTEMKGENILKKNHPEAAFNFGQIYLRIQDFAKEPDAIRLTVEALNAQD